MTTPSSKLTLQDIIASYKPNENPPIKNVTKRHMKLYNDQIYEKMQIPVNEKTHEEHRRISDLYHVGVDSDLVSEGLTVMKSLQKQKLLKNDIFHRYDVEVEDLYDNTDITEALTASRKSYLAGVASISTDNSTPWHNQSENNDFLSSYKTRNLSNKVLSPMKINTTMYALQHNSIGEYYLSDVLDPYQERKTVSWMFYLFALLM